jgi:uncharacterized damage-inducible protein DinB
LDLGDAALLVAHMEWADALLLRAVVRLPEEEWVAPLPSSYGSLAGAVEHLFSAEWTWLQRVRGESPTELGPAGGARDRERLLSLWPPVWAGWRDVAAWDAAAPVHYRTTRGTPHTQTLGELLLHVALHSATYRGQAAALLHQLGRTPPPGDLIAFLRQGD